MITWVECLTSGWERRGVAESPPGGDATPKRAAVPKNPSNRLTNITGKVYSRDEGVSIIELERGRAR